MVLHDQYTNSAEAAYSGAVTDIGDAATEVRVALLDASHAPDLDVHSAWGDVSADEITNTASNDTGYTAGGQELTSPSWTAGTNAVTFSGDNVTWTNSTIDAGYAVVYDATPASDADKRLLQLVDFEAEESSEDGDFTIDWHSDGIFEHTPRP